MKFYSHVLFFLIAFVSLISNFNYYRTSKLEPLILFDSENLSKDILNVKSFYPTLAFNSVPYTTYISQYYTANSNFDKVEKLLYKSLKSNKNCMYSRYLLSRNYILKKEYIKAEQNLEYLFNLNPNIESVSALYLSLLGEIKNYEKLIQIRPIIEKANNKILWDYFSAALLNSKS